MADASDRPANGKGRQTADDRFFRLVCEHAGVALVAAGCDLKIRGWNAAAGRMLGATAAQMVGTSVVSVLPVGDRSGAERLLRRALTHREVSEFEFQHRDSQGRPRYLAVAVSPIVDEEGVTLGVAAWIRDITRRTLLAKQIAHGHKMTALGQMAGALAHHFNNILGGLVTSLDFGLASGDTAVEHRVLEQAARSVGRAVHLVDSLLAFAEGDHRESHVSDLTEVVIQALEIVEPEVASAKVKLELNFKRIPVTEVPREQLMTVIFNLVHNAVEAMPDGGTLRISLEDAENHCILRFSDTGCGVAEENLDRIFEPFYSTKNIVDSDSEQAIGLGLAVAHGLVQEIGGRIRVTSRIDSGSTFEVVLPYKRPWDGSEGTDAEDRRTG